MMFASMKQRWAPKICSFVPLDLWHRLVDVELLLPYYHVVTDQEPLYDSGIYTFRSLKQFKADLEFFLRLYVPVSLQDVLSHFEGGRRLPERCFLLTFDDGFSEIHDVVAPILYKRGIPAVFFLTTSVIDNRDLIYPQKKSLLSNSLLSLKDSPAKQEVSRHLADAGIKKPDLPSCIRSITYPHRKLLDEVAHLLGFDFSEYAAANKPYLTSDQIIDLMKKGFVIGAHSVDHPFYSELTLEEQLSQTLESISWLSERYEFDCQAFAFPFNDVEVSLDFFKIAFGNGHLKISFGTGGMFRHFFPRNLERFTMEFAELSASQILARRFGKTFLRMP